MCTAEIRCWPTAAIPLDGVITAATEGTRDPLGSGNRLMISYRADASASADLRRRSRNAGMSSRSGGARVSDGAAVSFGGSDAGSGTKEGDGAVSSTRASRLAVASAGPERFSATGWFEPFSGAALCPPRNDCNRATGEVFSLTSNGLTVASCKTGCKPGCRGVCDRATGLQRWRWRCRLQHGCSAGCKVVCNR
jgi:hypothetical protein